MKQKLNAMIAATKTIGLMVFLKARRMDLTNAKNTVSMINNKAKKMTPREQYIELKKLGFTIGMIARQTGINKYKLQNMEFQNKYFLTDPQKYAFEAYYRVGKKMAREYGDKLSEHLADNEK